MSESNQPDRRPAIGIWHRYGPAAHTEEYPALPDLVTELSQPVDVHYFGMQTGQAVPAAIREHATVHNLPLHVNRASMRDKVWKTILWYLAIPFMALRCRRLGIQTLFIDESLPFSFIIIRCFFGRSIARTLTDFFLDIYLREHAVPGWLTRALSRLEINSWRPLPLIITRVEYTRRFLVGQGFDPARIAVLYNPCDLALYQPGDRMAGRRRYGIPPEAFVIVHHGVLHPNKANDHILNALAGMRATHPRLHYLLVGSGPELTRLRELTKSLGMSDHVTFTGWLNTESEVAEAINAADVGLVMRVGLESDHYHVTNTLVHEMACGLPILAARLAGIAEIIHHEDNGLLFDPADGESFRHQLARLADDPGLRARFGARSRQDAERLFDKTRIAHDTARLLLQVAHAK
ncbi:MAG: hypothetical protein A2498_14315 [Lentisphaerae bacterium RIFOXYC12_FULL_60_16]|nr:MAG: hypothetical protein A2498_14315 [Lentisphaerae bacterium RIFOXYC12_FULL_60_16]OGV79388.1 MAG: hypothetical protein A2340_05035 [Lentisphaerae bacterium RIFOXYB12_FULL_60_10]